MNPYKIKKREKSFPILIGIIFYISIVFVSSYSGRLAELIISLMILPYFLFLLKNKKIFLLNFTILFFIILLSLAATFISVFSEKSEFSEWQIFRSTVWLIVSIIGFCATENYKIEDKNKIEEIYIIVKCYVIISSLAVVVDIFYDLGISPSTITSFDEENSRNRIYIVASTAVIPFILLAIRRLDWTFAVAIFVTVWASGGKTLIAMYFFFVFLYIIQQKKRIVFIAPILLLAFFITISDKRFISYLEGGDDIRAEQSRDGYNEFSKNSMTMMIGIGHGTAYGLGYSQYNMHESNEKEDLIENSRFDVENFYMYLLMRLGILGTLLFIILMYRAFAEKFIKQAFLGSVLLYSLGGAIFTSPGGVLYIFSFLMIVSMYDWSRAVPRTAEPKQRLERPYF